MDPDRTIHNPTDQKFYNINLYSVEKVNYKGKGPKKMIFFFLDIKYAS